MLLLAAFVFTYDTPWPVFGLAFYMAAVGNKKLPESKTGKPGHIIGSH